MNENLFQLCIKRKKKDIFGQSQNDHPHAVHIKLPSLHHRARKPPNIGQMGWVCGIRLLVTQAAGCKLLPEGLVEVNTANKSSLENGHTCGTVSVCVCVCERVLCFESLSICGCVFVFECVRACVWLTVSQTEGQDDWWLPASFWACEAPSTDNEAKEEELPLIWLHTSTAHKDSDFVCSCAPACARDTCSVVKLCSPQGKLAESWAQRTPPRQRSYTGLFDTFLVQGSFHILMKHTEHSLVLNNDLTFWESFSKVI